MRQKLNNIVLCIDFDDTISVKGKFPVPGKQRKDSLQLINKLFLDGFYIIIWSCRSGLHKLQAEQWLMDEGYMFDQFNESRPTEKLLFNGEDTRKIWGTVYIDDRNLEWKINGMPEWNEIYKMCCQLGEENCIKE